MTRKMTLIAAAVAVALVAVWFAALWRPATSQLKTAQAALASAQQDQITAEMQQAVVRAKVKKMPQEEAKAAALEAAVPTTPNLEATIEQVGAIAEGAGVTWQSESQSFNQPASGAAASAGPQALTLNLSVTGTTAQILTFVSHLEAAPRVMQVDNLSLTLASGQAAAAGPVTTSVTATLFDDPTPLPKAPVVAAAASAH